MVIMTRIAWFVADDEMCKHNRQTLSFSKVVHTVSNRLD